MAGSLSLNGEWGLSWSDEFPDFLTGSALPARGQLKAITPAPVQATLMDAGLLDDPRVGMNSLRARWVEEQFWVYRRTFDTPEASGTFRLVFERLEQDAVVWLNGREVGRHANAHRPARFEVTDALRPAGEENVLVVRLDAGLFSSADKPGGDYNRAPNVLLTKRQWHRKGQWQAGWDWQQRLMNVGILGDARLEWATGATVKSVMVFAVPDESGAHAAVTARVIALRPSDAADEPTATIKVRVRGTDAAGETSVVLPAGESVHDLTVILESPALWWPVGHGEQPLYDVDVTLACGDEETTVTRRTGVRRVDVDQSAHPVAGTHFILRVNGRPIFCKGGNWVPADMLYSTIEPERYRRLVDLAVDAGFNLLRVWGGGIFADPELLARCDERGVLIWHDLLFACSKYPGDDPEFAAEVRREVTEAVRGMAHHPSLVVWCGNNEIEQGDWEWGYDRFGRTHPHYALFHHDLPRIVEREDPSKFYWISSPYSPNRETPNDPTTGDQHPWHVSLGQAAPDWWHYRRLVDRFPNEGGVLGAVSPATLRQFLPENERHLLSPSWEHHDNPFAMNPQKAGEVGRCYQTVQLWTGRDPLSMDWERYALTSALLQAEGLCEYISNYRRRMFSSSSAIFWMYNDSWPATHSWTIVDYYLRRKLSYHPVRRAYAPITVVAAEDEDGTIGYYVVNETAETWSGTLRCGILRVDGAVGETQDIPVSALPNAVTRAVVATPIADIRNIGIDRAGAMAVLYAEGGEVVAQHRLLIARFHELKLNRDPQIRVERGSDRITLTSDTFVWGVCPDTDGERPIADNCFDLLPGVPYTLPYTDDAGEFTLPFVGSRDVWG